MAVFSQKLKNFQINNNKTLSIKTGRGYGTSSYILEGITADENNIFTANSAEKNEVEEVKLKKLKKYVITGLSIKEDIDSSVVAETDTDRQEVLSNLIQRLVKEKKKTQTMNLESTMRKCLKKCFLLKRKPNLKYHQ